MRRRSQIIITQNQTRPIYDSCYRPSFCKKVDLDYLYCVSLATYNFISSQECQLYNYQLTGNLNKVDFISKFVNRLNHLIALLVLAKYQSDYNKESIEKYVSCEFLKCVQREFACLGYDITCVYKCFGVCGYCNDCETCKPN
jgi:hypothetical protein